MKDFTKLLLTFISGGIVLAVIAFAAMYLTVAVDRCCNNMPDKYTVHTLDKQYIGNATDYNFATHEEEVFDDVLIFETTQLRKNEKFGDCIDKEELVDFNGSDWAGTKDMCLYFANEHELAGHVKEGDTIIVRWVFDENCQLYAVKGVINETELKKGDY